MTTRILLADHQQLMRQGLRSLIEDELGMTVVGEAANGFEAIEQTSATAPNVVIMDISLPGMNGVEATREILQKAPHVRIIGLSDHQDHSVVAEMLKAGAVGYIPKQAAYEELRSAIESVQGGQTYLSPTITENIVDQYVRRPVAPDDTNTAFADLSDRERQVLQLVAEGATSKEIAESLGISARTADSHRRNIMEKLNVHSTAELTKYAVRHGLSSLEQ